GDGVVELAWKVRFPPKWRQSVRRGRLNATLELREGREPGPGDGQLSAWLAKEGVEPKPVLHLQVAGERAADFLERLAGHGLVKAKEGGGLEIGSGRRVRLERLERKGERVMLVAEEDEGDWCEFGGTFWRADEGGLTRAGVGRMPAMLRASFSGLAEGGGIALPLGEFLGNLEPLQEWLAFPEDSWLVRLKFVPAVSVVRLELEGSLNHLEAKLALGYGGVWVSPGLGVVEGLPRLLGERVEVRDFEAEKRAVSRIERAGFEVLERGSGRWVMKGEDAVVGFLTGVLPELRHEWEVVEGERFGHVAKQVDVVSPSIEILGSGEDWLSFDLKFQTNDGRSVPAEEVRKLLAGGRAKGGRKLVISNEVAQVIEPVFSDLELRQEGGRFETSARAGEVIREIRRKLAGGESVAVEEFAGAPGFVAELRPYQAQGAGWLLERVSRFGGALLADDMGLGKTVQTIGAVEVLLGSEREDSGVVLVVATASLLGNWKAEFAKFAPERRVWVMHGSGRDALRKKIGPGDVVLTSYGTLARDLAWHLKREYRAVVVDEASLMRNPDTDHAKAVCKMRSGSRIALTGTPLENGVRDLWSVFRFIQPGWLGGRKEFQERYEALLAGGDGAGVMERLRLKTSPFLLRRTKEQVAPELPEKILIDDYCELGADQQGVYRAFLEEGRRRVEEMEDAKQQGAARMRMLTALLRLRQTCCDLALLGNEKWSKLAEPKRSAKMVRLMELLEEAVSGGHRVLVFSQFQKQLVEIEKAVRGRGWESLRLDGQTRKRQELVDRFQADDGPPVFLISLKAGGYGLNLTAADTVIHFDPWWNPAAEMQATDRAHRIGQTRPVTVYRLLTRNTVEEKVVRLQAKKRELAAAIDESGGGDAAGWSLEELEGLMD
ncbi:MAG: DEAD/DEAH box helicase, partial [Verrucomicrobiota bacterium JB025]|nr:SNF2-related protein [Verrucomicrobiota bacterium JB025]